MSKSILHKAHKDFEFCRVTIQLVKEYAAAYSDHSMLLIFDDKNKVYIGEPGKTINALRQKKPVLMSVDVVKTQDDHDAGGCVFKAVPTVILVPDVREANCFQGTLYIACKEGVTQPSTSERAAAELSWTIKDIQSKADASFRLWLAFLTSDGGSEHNISLSAVQRQLMLIFLDSNLDGLFAAKSCPNNSWTQEVERYMSWLNFALYGIQLSREVLPYANYERMVTGAESTKDLRERILHNPDLRDCLDSVMEPIMTGLEDAFLQCHFQNTVPTRGCRASDDDITKVKRQMAKISSTAEVLVQEPTNLSNKALADDERLSLYMKTHCFLSTYTFSILKTCWIKAAFKLKELNPNITDAEIDQMDISRVECPFACTKPHIPLSKYMHMMEVPGPSKVPPPAGASFVIIAEHYKDKPWLSFEDICINGTHDGDLHLDGQRLDALAVASIGQYLPTISQIKWILN
jgi:hypothetical protein